MTRIRLFAASFAVAGAACLTTHARAGDLPAQAQAYKAPAIIAPSWTGFYIGINGGYGWGRTSSTITPNAAEVGNGAGDPQYNNLFPAGPKADGFVGGAQIGVNKQFDRVVAGLEADLSYADLAATTSVTGLPFIGGTFHTALESRLRWFGCSMRPAALPSAKPERHSPRRTSRAPTPALNRISIARPAHRPRHPSDGRWAAAPNMRYLPPGA
jgi:outer membrane immunogenic protein